jgi:hypothetical protein
MLLLGNGTTVLERTAGPAKRDRTDPERSDR